MQYSLWNDDRNSCCFKIEIGICELIEANKKFTGVERMILKAYQKTETLSDILLALSMIVKKIEDKHGNT